MADKIEILVWWIMGAFAAWCLMMAAGCFLRLAADRFADYVVKRVIEEMQRLDETHG